MVIAGPGSGKTRVLTYRIAHLINSGIPPYRILALTFTNKAAKEMKERIEAVVGPSAQDVWAGTFHSIFARILRVEANKVGYPSNFSIYDSQDSRNMVGRIVKELNLDKNNYPASTVCARISSAKSNLITPKLYVAQEDLMQSDRYNNRPHLHNIYAKYVAQCKQAGAMDFDDLLYRLFELLQKNPDDVVDKYRKKFSHLLVDEFQDTNYLQYQIIKKLVKYPGSKENICIVGDDAQSIYAFRGATIDNILNFQKEFPKLSVFKLEQNYRSTTSIVEAANQVIQQNRKQIQKRIWTDKPDNSKIKVIKTVTDNEEGRRIADTIVEYKNRFHVPNEEIAVLYRTNAQSRVFEEYLRRYNIPYKVFGGLSFYQRKEVKDLLAYLRLAVNQQDEEALRRVINYPKRGIGNSSVEAISDYAREREISLWQSVKECPLKPRARKLVDGFASLIEGFAERASNATSAFEAASYIAHATRIIDTLRADNSLEGIGRLENLTALLDGIKEFSDDDEVDDQRLTEDKSLATYLQNIALVTDLDENDNNRDYVTLMSVHSAKGLEFDAVFAVGLEEKIFPSAQALDTEDGIDEERRLFFVAITRARKFLTLSFAGARYRYGKIVQNKPSRFLNEIAPELLDGTVRRPVAPTVEGQRAKIQGNFAPRATRAKTAVAVPKNFVAAAPHEINAGMKVKHLKFGKGKVLSIDGYNDAKVATIFFQGIHNPRRRIMLKFAKLQIID